MTPFVLIVFMMGVVAAMSDSTPDGDAPMADSMLSLLPLSPMAKSPNPLFQFVSQYSERVFYGCRYLNRVERRVALVMSPKSGLLLRQGVVKQLDSRKCVKVDGRVGERPLQVVSICNHRSVSTTLSLSEVRPHFVTDSHGSELVTKYLNT